MATIKCDWAAVRSQTDANVLREAASGFEDAITIAARWVGGETIDDLGSLNCGARGDLMLSIQSQFLDVAELEIKFVQVDRFSYDFQYDAELRVGFRDTDVEVRLLAWSIVAAKILWRQKHSC